jgi:hypothetical protein
MRGFPVDQDVLIRFLAVLASHVGGDDIERLPGGAVAVSGIGLVARGELLYDVVGKAFGELRGGLARTLDNRVAAAGTGEHSAGAG